jgi:hypothetical protein
VTGGFAASKLREAGAVQVFTGLAELRAALAELPVIGRVEAGTAADDG